MRSDTRVCSVFLRLVHRKPPRKWPISGQGTFSRQYPQNRIRKIRGRRRWNVQGARDRILCLLQELLSVPGICPGLAAFENAGQKVFSPFPDYPDRSRIGGIKPRTYDCFRDTCRNPVFREVDSGKFASAISVYSGKSSVKNAVLQEGQ